jgi:hypothetical protein
MISPTRYTEAISPISVEVMPRVSGWVSTPVTELAMVICRPSRIHAAPSPHTMRVWNFDHPRRSRRAGMVLRIGSWTAAVVLTGRPPLRSRVWQGEHPAGSRVAHHSIGLKSAAIQTRVEDGAGCRRARTKDSPPMTTAATAVNP